jgi:two-component system, NtrC family, sensor histidine kinase HydH
MGTIAGALARRYRNLRLATRFGLHIAASTTVLFAILIPIVVHLQTRAVLAEAHRRGLELTKVFAHAGVQALVADDFLVMRYIVNSVASEPDVVYAMIVDPSGRVLLHSDVRETGRLYTDALTTAAKTISAPLRQDVWRPGAHLFDFAVPVYVLMERRAIARVGLSVEPELAAIRRTRDLIVGLALASLLAGLLVAWRQARSVTEPLAGLVADAETIAAGDLGHTIQPRATDEVGRLTDAFSRMAESLKGRIEQLRDVQGELVRKTRLAAIGEIAAGVAHEARNPLGALTNCVSMLRKSVPANPADKELLEIMQDEVNRLNGLVSDFLTFGRPRPPEPRPVDVPRLVDTVLSALERDERCGYNIAIERRFAAATAHVDPDQLRQVLWNVLLNAVQAMGSAGTLTVGTERMANAVTITVADTGPGIPAALRDRVFEPFCSGRVGGTGLGLAIVKRIVEEHGGQVDVESAEGRGARFIITLPSAEAAVAHP